MTPTKTFYSCYKESTPAQASPYGEYNTGATQYQLETRSLLKHRKSVVFPDS